MKFKLNIRSESASAKRKLIAMEKITVTPITPNADKTSFFENSTCLPRKHAEITTIKSSAKTI